MKRPCIVIGGGLSGLAAGIRLARFIPDVLILEQHSRLGGLNSYYYRNRVLIETGLHAITNYAESGDKRAPLNRLLRQLKLSRKKLNFHQQKKSKIVFTHGATLQFSNDFELLRAEVNRTFPHCLAGFDTLCAFLQEFDPFAPRPFTSARRYLLETIPEPLLVDMLLCPLMYYGSSVENDMDLSQFAIMFQAIFQEGFFRPAGTIRDFLHTLTDHYLSLGGEVRTSSRVQRILHRGKKVHGVELASGEILECDHLLSTVGHHETLELLGMKKSHTEPSRLGFVESVFQLPITTRKKLPDDTTVIFYSDRESFAYENPASAVDFTSGVVCLPHNFQNLQLREHLEVRSTHLASYTRWMEMRPNREKYNQQKADVRLSSKKVIEKFVGKFSSDIIYEDTFTPVTIERYTAKKGGAIYGSPDKLKDGDLGYDNLFLAGTDQGFLGIVGAMLSGVSITNQHILPKT